MATAVNTPAESLGFYAWFREFLKDELSPYPGRGVAVARMVLSATVTMLLIMTFRIPGGAQGALYAFLISRDNLRATLTSGISIAVSYVLGACFVIMGAGVFVDHPSGRFVWFAGSMFVVFFALRALNEYSVATGFAILTVNALPIWQMTATAENRVEHTLWRAFAVGIGTAVTVSIEAIFHAFHAKDELSQGIDERLAMVSELLAAYIDERPVPVELANRLAQYTIVGASRLRRILARSSYERLQRDQLTAVVALTGRLIDLAAASARGPHQARAGDRNRLKKILDQISEIRASLAAGRIPHTQIKVTSASTGIPLLPEMERTVVLIPGIFAGSESLDVFLPSVIERENHSIAFFKEDAFRNPAYIHFAMRGCLAATLCYFTYEVLNWKGLSTSVTTCAITALSNAGTSRQKQVLRIAGAVAGGFVFGIGSQIFVLPYIDSIAAFTVLFVAVTAVGGWCATSSQRLSYFGIQLLLAFYLINLQEFTIQTSLSIARDRVLGILLGLSVMWLVFDNLGSASASEEMIEAFIATLRGIADLVVQPGSRSPDVAIRQIRKLRDEVNMSFQAVNAQADAVPFEFGMRREQGMHDRQLVRSWQPAVRTLYLREVALLQHRIFASESDLPEEFQAAQAKFNDSSAVLLRRLALHLDRGDASRSTLVTEDLNTPLQMMRDTLVGIEAQSPIHAKAQGVIEVSSQIQDQLSDLSADILNASFNSREIPA